MRIVADTAILVRGHAKAAGPARELLLWIERRRARLVVSPYLLAEVQRVLSYPRLQKLFGLSAGQIEQYVGQLEALAEVVDPYEGLPIATQDPDDDPVIYTALAAGADVLCTLDRHFFRPEVLSFCSRHGISVMTDLELLLLLRQGGDA